jgi:hypothetical protein
MKQSVKETRDRAKDRLADDIAPPAPYLLPRQMELLK